MRETKWITRLTCDRCGQEVKFLTSIYIGNSSTCYCEHQSNFDLCDVCLSELNVWREDGRNDN
jgi:hypothetical protein